jgi:hypothetical protein
MLHNVAMVPSLNRYPSIHLDFILNRSHGFALQRLAVVTMKLM